jgi:hypothetical protein
VDGYYYASGKNLFDGEFKTGAYLLLTGIYSPIGASRISNVNEFIPIKPSTNYIINSPSYVEYFFYDINKTFISFIAKSSGVFVSSPSNAYYLNINLGDTSNLNLISQLEQGTTSTSHEAFATPTTTLNLTFLFGIGNEPNKATMDGYYAEYEEYLEYLYVCCNIFATQTISFETIYFDDGVSTEIEKLGSILIFTLIGFTLMIFGFASKRRIFNLLSIGAFIVLGVLLAEFAGFLIIVFGLVVLNLYYTFLGDI